MGSNPPAMSQAMAARTGAIAMRRRLRERGAFWLAITVSVAIHVAAYTLTPHFVAIWKETAAVRYDAVLLPPSRELLGAAPTQRPKVVKPQSGRKARVAPAPSPAPVETPGESQITEPAATDAPAIADPVAAANTAEPAPAAAGDNPATPDATAALAEPVVEPLPPELPTRISITYRASSSISDGVADYSWKRNGKQYEVDSSLQASGFVIAMFAGVLHQVSKGEITATGLEPAHFMMRRGDAVPDTAEFLRASGELKLTRGGNSRLLPMPAKLQDTQSFLFQLAFDAPRLKSPEDKLEIVVTNARKVYRHLFRQLGETAMETRFGPVNTLHLLSEAADPEDAYEVWLAPEHYYLPVKLKFYAGRFPIELIATSIRSTP